MKRIVCYGDSNTWGANPHDNSKRFGPDTRWTGVLQQQLGDGYVVIEEGLNGRTTVWEDPIEPGRNGAVYLPPCLLTHRPFDLITIMLGTNDLKMRHSVPARDIAAGAGLLVDAVKQSIAGIDDQPPQVLLISPPPVAPLAGTPYADMFVGAEEKSQKLAEWFRAVAEERGCPFMNAGDVIESSPVDAIHFEADAHRKLGAAIAAKVKEILG